jgi:hypothetical protein
MLLLSCDILCHGTGQEVKVWVEGKSLGNLDKSCCGRQVINPGNENPSKERRNLGWSGEMCACLGRWRVVTCSGVRSVQIISINVQYVTLRLRNLGRGSSVDVTLAH